MEKINFEILTTIVLAFIGYIYTYFNNKKTRKREEQLKLINQRLEKFYGPMYFLTIAGRTSYQTLLNKLGRNLVNVNPTEVELKEWREWVINIFMPDNRVQRDIIYKNAYLILESDTPECLVTFVKHVSEFEVILKKWEKSDFSENFPSIDYPRDMQNYVKNSFLRLKKEQSELI